MYEFIDRPVSSLSAGAGLLTIAMRRWVKGVCLSKCTCGEIAAEFNTRGLEMALPHFHTMMMVLSRGAKMQLRFNWEGCETVSEHEAVILSLVCNIRKWPAQRARETAVFFSDEETLPYLVSAINSIARTMAASGEYEVEPSPQASGLAGRTGKTA